MVLLLSAAGQAPFPGVINIDGLGGGLCEQRASLLANHGFATLALAYYQYEDLIQKPTKLHLEYFEEAVNYMLQHTQVVMLPALWDPENASSLECLSLHQSYLRGKLLDACPTPWLASAGCLSSREEEGLNRYALERCWKERKHAQKRQLRHNKVERFEESLHESPPFFPSPSGQVFSTCPAEKVIIVIPSFVLFCNLSTLHNILIQ